MKRMQNRGAGILLKAVAAVIVANKAYLSEIDGKIGDGDHGVNMAKGFSRASDQLTGVETLDVALQTLSDVLMNEIGGSMGPLYGLMFAEMASEVEARESIDLAVFTQMLKAGINAVSEIGNAKVGDKTILDTLVPVVAYLEDAVARHVMFEDALTQMKHVAQAGRDSTIDMVANVGRSSRLGERSRGILDAGATSCCLILEALADGCLQRLN